MAAILIPQFEPWIRPRYLRAVAEQVRSGWIGPGERTRALEATIARTCGVPHAVATTSGTTALLIALKALDLPEHSTVLFPAYAFPAGANAARFLGLRVRLVDIHPDTLCLDPQLVEQMLRREPNVGAVLFVNHNGYVGRDVRRVEELCRAARVPLIEDAAVAFGIPEAGTVGDIATFSFSVPKLITTGQGGAVITSRDDLAARVRQIIDHGGGWRETRRQRHDGVNFRLTDLQAALGLAQIADLALLLRRRRAIWRWYREAGIKLWDIYPPSSVGWCAIVASPRAERLVSELNDRGIGAAQYYRPMSAHVPYQTPGEQFPAADEAARTLVYLPSSLTLSRDQVATVAAAVQEIESS
jgi:perosamine synthetase